MVAKRRDGLVVEDVHDEVLVLNPSQGQATALNASAALVFEMCDGEHTIDDMKQAIDAAGLGPSTDDTIWLALTELTDADLIELQIPRARHLGRRELLKLSGAGAASIAALPVVETIGTPSPDSAGSPGGGVAPAGGEATPAPTPSPATPAPTPAPTDAPTTAAPTAAPTGAPTTAPTNAPTGAPTSAPTAAPTNAPTPSPGTLAPTPSPGTTFAPSSPPTPSPTAR